MLDSLLNNKGNSQPQDKSIAQQWNELAYRTQRNYERTLRQHLTEKYGIEMASEVAEHVTSYIFNFGEFDFPMNSSVELRRATQAELVQACRIQPIEPEVLCHVMIHRGAARRRDPDDFALHMRNLWLLCMLPVGTLTPESELLDAKYEPYIDKVARIEISTEEIDRYAEVWASEVAEENTDGSGTDSGGAGANDMSGQGATGSIESAANATAGVDPTQQNRQT